MNVKEQSRDPLLKKQSNRNNRSNNMKKSEWDIEDYEVGELSPSKLADQITEICIRGYEVYKISEITSHVKVSKLLNSFDEVVHDSVSLENGDILQHVNWTRVYFKK